MGDILSQSQIDALMNSLKSDDDEINSIDSNKDKLVKKYDFYSPKKFTKDRLKLLDSVFDGYGRIISSHLTSILRLATDIELVNIEEQRYFEFNNALTENDILSLTYAKLDNKVYKSDPILVQITNQTLFCMIDRMLGGEGDAFEDNFNGYTDIELALYENIIKHIIPHMSDSWKNYLKVNFEYQKYEVNPRLIQNISMDEIVVIIVFDIKIKDINGKINVCIPGNLLTNIFMIIENEISNNNKRKDNSVNSSAEDILKSIKKTALEIKGSLGQAELMLKDIYDLKVGDVIKLDKPKDADIMLYIEEKPWFTAKLGVYKQYIAVRVTNIMNNYE